MTTLVATNAPNVHFHADDLVINTTARKATFTFGAGDDATFTVGDAKVITFTARHNNHRKAYTAELAVAEKKGAFLVTGFMVFGDNPHIHEFGMEPCGRYGVKAFTAYAEAAFAAALEIVEDFAARNGVEL